MKLFTFSGNPSFNDFTVASVTFLEQLYHLRLKSVMSLDTFPVFFISLFTRAQYLSTGRSSGHFGEFDPRDIIIGIPLKSLFARVT